MTGWAFFFMLVGVTFLTAQLFRVIDYIERPAGVTIAAPWPDNEMRLWMFWRN